VSSDPFIAYTSNVFAILSLRSLTFVGGSHRSIYVPAVRVRRCARFCKYYDVVVDIYKIPIGIPLAGLRFSFSGWSGGSNKALLRFLSRRPGLAHRGDSGNVGLNLPRNIAKIISQSRAAACAVGYSCRCYRGSPFQIFAKLNYPLTSKLTHVAAIG
jgi:hypothetical protein